MQYRSNNFLVRSRHQNNKFFLTQQVTHPAVHTSELPETVELLENYLPTIFSNECFNYKKQCFKDEAKSTEIGHLFEHMILENLKLIAEMNSQSGDFRGETSWDWIRQKKGQFKIIIYSEKIGEREFSQAFNKSIYLLEKIYSEHAKR